MKKLSIILAVTMLLSLLSVFPTVSFAETATAGSTSGISVWDGTFPETGAGQYDGGSGTKDDPYLISSAITLVKLSRNTNNAINEDGKYFKITTDIALNPDYENYMNWGTTAPKYTWNPIRKSGQFTGYIDGDGHTIYGMYVSNTSTTSSESAGFIAQLKGTVENLAFENCYVKRNNCLDRNNCGRNSGIVCGTLGVNGASVHPTISNVQVKDCYVATVRGGGLIAGTAYNGTVTNVFASGTLGGGLNTEMDSASEKPSNESDIGGLIGWLNKSTDGSYTIKNAVVLPKFALVSGAGTYGCVFGNDSAATKTYSNLYFDTSVSGFSQSIGYPKTTTVEGQFISTAVSSLKVASSALSADFWKDSANGPVLKSFVKAEEKPVEPTRPVSVWDGVTPTHEAGYKLSGSGTEADPYLIQNANDLAFFARTTNCGINYAAGTYVKLTTDIVINADHANYMNWSTTAPTRSGFPTIAKGGTSFKGVFDGDGHIIYGGYWKDTNCGTSDNNWAQTSGFSAGFFGRLEGTVKNLGFVHCVSIHTAEFGVGAGIIAEHLGNKNNDARAVIENCFVEDSYSAGWRCAGLIAGTSANAVVKNCYATGIVAGGRSGESDMGGIIGYSKDKKCEISGVYAIPTFSLASGATGVGCIIGNCAPSDTTVEKAYFDSGKSNVSDGIKYGTGTGKVVTDLKGKAFDLSNMALDKNVWRDSANGPVLITFAGPAGEIVERSVSVGDSYAVNFVVDTNVDGTWTMDFTCGNKTTTAEPVETDDGTEFRISGINPQQMTATIKAELKLNGEVVDTKETTLKDYFIALYEQTDDDNIKTFLADTLAYGDAAQAFCGLTPDTMKDIEWQTSTFNAEDVTSVRSGSGAVKAAGLVLSDYNYIYFRFTKDATSFKILCNDVLVEECLDIASRCTDVTVNSVVYNKVMTSALKATEGDAKYTIQVFNGDELIGTATYSVYSYVAAMYDCGTAALENIVKTLFNYCRSAAAVSAK